MGTLWYFNIVNKPLKNKKDTVTTIKLLTS